MDTPKEKAIKYLASNDGLHYDGTMWDDIEKAIDIALKEQAKEIESVLKDRLKRIELITENTDCINCSINAQNMLVVFLQYVLKKR